MRKTINIIYITVVGIVFGTFAVVFTTFSRPTFSELERRELATFPEFSTEKLFNGTFTDSVSKWFSDSEPFRDKLLQLSLQFSDCLKIGKGESKITFHAADAPPPGEEEMAAEDKLTAKDNRVVHDYNNEVNADDKAKIAHRGIIVVGEVPHVRALMAYGGTDQGGVPYANAANKYKRTFGDKVNVYCMVVPTATDYYLPKEAKDASKPQAPTINNIYAHLDKDVKAVDVYTILGVHAKEDIFLRTDHHWSPLGGYYAAKQFAKVAGVPFRDTTAYQRHVVHGYVGTMYGYSKDIAVKNSPEDFVYWTPKKIKYTTTYINYRVNKDFKVTGESGPVKGDFFVHYPDGSSAAYCTFMGGDSKITQVRTATKNHRRLIILKDSYGNTLPGWLFYSFEEIHVIDSRYFTKNMVKYVEDNKITDILFANNIFKAYSGTICKEYEAFLTQ